VNQRDRTWQSLLAMLLMGLLSTTAWAYTAEPQTLRDVQLSSEAVVEGEVTGSRTVPHATDPGWAFTHYTVRVDQVLSGSVPDEIEVVVPGGPVASGRIPIVPGAPYLKLNEHVLLHLTLHTDGVAYRLPSWSHGVLRERDGLALLGADAVAAPDWSCEDAPPAVLTAHEPPPPHPLADEEEGMGLTTTRVPMSWAAAVEIVHNCLDEKAP